MLQYLAVMLIIGCTSIWTIAAIWRIRQGRDLGRVLRQTVWLPLVVTVTFVAHRVYATRTVINLLQEGGAINDKQRQLLIDAMIHEIVTVATLGVVVTGFLWAIGRFQKQLMRRRP